MGPASRRNLSGMNPRQRRGILLLTLSALGLLGVFVLVAGYVADVRAEVDPKIEVLTLARPAEKDKSITDDMVRTTRCRANGRRRRSCATARG